MSWLLAKLSGKCDNILVETTTPESPPELYSSIPKDSYPTPCLPYNIMPTPVMPETTDLNVLPHTLDKMKVKFKFIYDSNMEDIEMNQIMKLLSQCKQTSQNLEHFISKIDNIDFLLERNVISSN